MGSERQYIGRGRAKLHETLFATRRWFDLVPDQAHEVVTAGYDGVSCTVGTFMAYVGKDRMSLLARALRRVRGYLGFGYINTNTCATAARTSDGSLVIVYMPSLRSITVDMTKLSGTAVARWYDPTNGKYTNVIGAPAANEGSRQFSPPRFNQSGESDWVLVLEAASPH